MNEFLKSISQFRMLEEKWNLKNEEWCNIYRSELILRVLNLNILIYLILEFCKS